MVVGGHVYRCKYCESCPQCVFAFGAGTLKFPPPSQSSHPILVQRPFQIVSWSYPQQRMGEQICSGPTRFLNQRVPSFLNCFKKSVCVYLPIFVCSYRLTCVNNFLSGKYCLYTRDKGPINPIISYCTSKFRFKGGFLFQAKKQVWWLTTDIKSGFHCGFFSGVFQLKNT